MQKTEKERVVAELTEQLRSTESLIVADYRGLTNSELAELRTKLRGSGAKFQVVKNTLTRRAAEEAGAESLLALLEGPTAIAFVETDGDPVAVAKALADAAKETKILTLRGGILSGRPLTEAQLDELAKLPSPEIVKSQLVGVIVAPITQLVGLLAAPVRDLVGLIDARIDQLGGATVEEAEPETPVPAGAPEPDASADEVADTPEIVAEATEADAGVAEPETETHESPQTAEPAETSESEE